MKIKSLSVPRFFIDSLPGILNTQCRVLLRCTEIHAEAPEIFAWLKQLRVAPYSYDFIDNRCRRSPDYIIENLPPLKAHTHFLLAFHVLGFEEDSFIACRFCEPINPPVNQYMKGMVIEYRIEKRGTNVQLWCKIKGYFNQNISSQGFFVIFSVVNKIMMIKQLKNIKTLAERLTRGQVETRTYDFAHCYAQSGIHWWLFCRRHNCKGLIIEPVSD